MRTLTIKEAKAHLNELVEAAINGEDVVLMRGSKHVAAIVPLTEEDLRIASRLTDDQAARLWKALAAERAAGKTLDFDSMEGAVTGLREPTASGSRRRPASKTPARRSRGA